MRILHVTPAYKPAWHLGGVVRSVGQLCRGLAALGHEVTVFTTDSGGDRRMEVPVNRPVDVGGVEVWYFRTDFSLKYFYSPALGEACRQRIKNFDVIHLTSYWSYPAIPAFKACLRYGLPYVVSPRGTLRRSALMTNAYKKLPYFYLIDGKITKSASALHYTTSMERELDAFHRFPNPSFLVPNGFDLGEFDRKEETQVAKKTFGLDNGVKVITFLGRLHSVKSLDLLIEAIAMPECQELGVILLLAGPNDGAERELQCLTERLRLNGKVRFLGKVDPKYRNLLFSASDVLVLVSRDENFGNVAVEAMLAGVPVLVSEHVGICREVASDGAGVVVPLQVEAIAAALKRMFSDPEGLRAMGARARAAARRRYDIKVVAQMMATAYEDLLTGRRSQGLGWSDDDHHQRLRYGQGCCFCYHSHVQRRD